MDAIMQWVEVLTAISVALGSAIIILFALHYVREGVLWAKEKIRSSLRK